MHVAIHPAHRKYLRFEYADSHFQYHAMLFGLSSAPRTFIKLVAVAATLRVIPVCVLCYLNNILILSSSQSQAIRDMVLVIRVF